MSDVLTKQDFDMVIDTVAKHKKSQDEALAAVKELIRTDYATPGALKELEDKFEAKFKTMNEYSEQLERQIKGKELSKEEQKGFATLLAEGLEKDWSEITRFKSSSKGKVFQLTNMKAAADMTIANSVTDPGAYFTTVLPGIRTLPNRRVHMRDIINLGTMTNSSVDYVREESVTGDLTTVAEGAAKPQIQPLFSERQATAQYIAGWLRISRKMLDDMQALRSYLQMRLMEMYLKVEDAQILSGDGTGSNLEGILTVATALNDNTGPNVERIVHAISQLESADYYATGVVLHPAAYYEIALNKAAGSGEYDLPLALVVIQNGQLYVAGVPVYKTTAMPRATFVVGDWDLGAQLFIREQPVVEFFDQDANNVTTNKITVRIEGRVALAIYREAAFVQGTFDNIPVS